MAAKSFKVVSPVRHDGKDYKPGRKINLEPEHAESLLAAGAVEEDKAAKDTGKAPDKTEGNEKTGKDDKDGK